MVIRLDGKSSRWWVIAASVSEHYVTLKLQAKFPLCHIELNSWGSGPFFACHSSDGGSIPRQGSSFIFFKPF